MNKKNKIIKRGGDDLERLYLYDYETKTADKRTIKFFKTYFPKIGDRMDDIRMRHLGRYGFVLPFIRSGYRILDFPCGSGIAVEVFSLLKRFGDFQYEGWDIDAETILYAQGVYGRKRPWVSFKIADLTDFELQPQTYDTICCIEGLEHITKEAQKRMVAEFVKGLKKGGTFIVSSPSPESNASGPNLKNRYHLYELTKEDLLSLLTEYFGINNVEIISQKNLLTTGQLSECYYAICHKK